MYSHVSPTMFLDFLQHLIELIFLLSQLLTALVQLCEQWSHLSHFQLWF